MCWEQGHMVIASTQMYVVTVLMHMAMRELCKPRN